MWGAPGSCNSERVEPDLESYCSQFRDQVDLWIIVLLAHRLPVSHPTSVLEGDYRV